MNPSVSLRRVERIRHELHRREVVVRHVSVLGPHFVAITFAADTLAGFVSASFDDHVKFLFTDAHGQTIRRDYTPRHHDAARGELTIEFALHDSGPATDWARHAQVGDRATIAGPRGSMVIPSDYPWQLLAGDDTALPAIHRRLEELPAGVQTRVLLMAPNLDVRRPLTSAAHLQTTWVSSPAQLLAGARALDLHGDDEFVWAAGESSLMASLRKVFLDEKQHPRTAMRVAAYWKQGAMEYHENLEG